jgi:hypothetical protein
LTDEQRAVVIGRLYKTVKQNPLLNLKQFQTDNGDRELNLSSRSGSDATARAIAEQVGVGQATVRRAEKFADAVEALQEVSSQAAERVLFEILIWVDRNQLGRRNLTDEQRAVVMGRLYKAVKQNPILNLKPFQTDNGDREVKLTSLSGSDATARALAKQIGVGEKTIRRAEKFTDAVEMLREVSPQAAERVLRGEVRDALTELPKVPREALSFVASADFQHRPASWTVTFPLLVASPHNRRCPRSKTLPHSKERGAL